MLKRAKTTVHTTLNYEATLDADTGRLAVRSATTRRIVLDVPVDSAIDTVGVLDQGGHMIRILDVLEDPTALTMTLEVESSLWRSKRITLRFADDHLTYQVSIEGAGQRVLDANLFLDRGREPGLTDFAEVYVPRFDWFQGQIFAATGENESLAVQQWLSPPPLTYVLTAPGEHIWFAAAPRPGEYNFQSFDYRGETGTSFRLTYEAHTEVNGSFAFPAIVIGFTATGPNEAVAASIDWLRTHDHLPKIETTKHPAWWSEPIFCGWGQMRHDYRRDHQGHENGNFINVTSYCTELRYRNYLDALDEARIDPGTIVIDMGWARHAALGQPDPDRWTDLRGFVDEQHSRGRRVLLWYSPVVAQGLPVAACMTLEGEIIAPDPTSPEYVQILEETIHTMLSGESGCLDADGIKIDFTQCVPAEDGRFVSRIPHFGGLINESDESLMYPRLSTGRTTLIATHEPIWGIEMIRRSVALLYAATKRAKPDAMVMAHTANPYFADIVDVLRLNDLDGDCTDVLGVMRNRAALAAMCSANWLIDTDDDLMVDRDSWLAYAELQPELGIPDTYYATGIAQSQEPLRPQDLDRLRDAWSRYRSVIGSTTGHAML